MAVNVLIAVCLHFTRAKTEMPVLHRLRAYRNVFVLTCRRETERYSAVVRTANSCRDF